MNEKRVLISDGVKGRLYGCKISVPRITPDQCRGCGQCVKSCPTQVFVLRNGKSTVVYGEACIGCGHCWAVCPEQAVSLGQREDLEDDSPPTSQPAIDPGALKQFLRQRRAIRRFTTEPVSRAQLNQILDAGRYAPTSCNLQDVHYVVLPTRAKVDELRCLEDAFLARFFRRLDGRLLGIFLSMRWGRATLSMLRSYGSLFPLVQQSETAHCNAFLPYGTAAIVAHAPSSDPMAGVHCALALYHCTLMANSLGLGSSFVGCVHLAVNADKRIKHWLGIPRHHRCEGAIILGYPDVIYRRLPPRRPPRVQWL